MRLFPILFRSSGATLFIFMAVASAGTWAGWMASGPAHAQAGSDEDVASEKAYWQERYRTLRSEAARLRQEVESAKEGYAAANRRNYRRGAVRHEYREKMLEAEKELARVERELAALPDEARRSGALPGWLYEVEAEPVVVPKKASGANGDRDDQDTDDEDDDGEENPLYRDDEEEEDW